MFLIIVKVKITGCFHYVIGDKPAYSLWQIGTPWNVRTPVGGGGTFSTPFQTGSGVQTPSVVQWVLCLFTGIKVTEAWQ